MRALAIIGLVSLLAAVGAAPALAQSDQGGCGPGPGGGGLVGGVGRVTRQIDESGCPGQGTDAAPPAPPGDCTSVLLAYSPAAIRYGSLFVGPTLSYLPAGCRVPTGYPAYRLRAGSEKIFSLNEISGTVIVSENTAGAATVEVTHGSLPPATAEITSVALADCTKMILAYTPRTIHVDEMARPSITFEPADCLEPYGPATFQSADPRVGWVAEGSGSIERGTVSGLSEGTARITARQGSLTADATVAVVNVGPDCTAIELSYPDRMPLGASTRQSEDTRISPTLRYSPTPCKHPPGAPQFEAITPDLVRVIGDSGVVTALKLGTAQVRAKHGALTAVAKIEIVPVPACDYLALTYGFNLDNRIMLHERGPAHLTYTSDALSGQFRDQCAKPDGRPQFSAQTSGAGASPVLELASDGTITGIAGGSVTVKVAHGNLANHADVTVNDQGPPCTKLNASFQPPLIAVGETSQLVTSNEPQGCIPPGPVKFAKFPSSDWVDWSGMANQSAAGIYLAEVFEQSTDYATHLVARAYLRVIGGCTGLSAAVNPDTIQLGSEAPLILTYTPEGCTPVEKAHVTLFDDILTERENVNGSIVLVGRRGGQTDVNVHTDQLGVDTSGHPIVGNVVLHITVNAPACIGLSIAYPEPKFDPHMKPQSGREFALAGGTPTLSYTPEGCMKPDGYPIYTSDSSAFKIWSGGEIELHPAKSGNASARWATITVKHGTLTAETRVGEF